MVLGDVIVGKDMMNPELHDRPLGTKRKCKRRCIALDVRIEYNVVVIRLQLPSKYKHGTSRHSSLVFGLEESFPRRISFAFDHQDGETDLEEMLCGVGVQFLVALKGF